MVEPSNFGIEPVVCRVTVLAISRELNFHMARVRGRGEVLQVAGVARRRHGLEFAGGSVLMTGVAVHGGVRTRQREAVVVLVDILNGDLPSPDCMALLTVSSQLSPVNISVAVLATLTDT